MEYKVSDKEVEKRYSIEKGRFSALQQEGNVYVVRCVMDSCLEEVPVEICQRGFFSLFLQAVQGIYISTRFAIPCYIDFGHKPMLYSDPGRFDGDLNFWNYYFHQPFIEKLDPRQPYILNSYYETFPLRIWDSIFFKKSGDIVKKYIRFRQPVIDKIDLVKAEFSNNKVLGVQIRRTDHPGEISAVGLGNFIRTINKNLKNHDKVFVATDDSEVIEILKKEFGKDKILYNAVNRSSDSMPVHKNMTLMNRYELGMEALVDGYCLSLCNKAILMHSNISYACMFFNPKLPYILMENRDTKIKRWKTQLLYRLHVNGIRTL